MPSELSGGQQQRVAVARSLVLEPAVLLFDEPLSNLDAKLRRRVRQEIRELQQSLSLTVIYVTHDQEEALAVSDHIIVMEGGRIAQQGTPHDLYEQAGVRFLADFIGDANLIDGELTLEGGGAKFVANDLGVVVRADGMAPGPATLAIRPHRLRVVALGEGALPGVCKRAAYLGSRIEYVVETPWGELLVFDGEARAPRGSRRAGRCRVRHRRGYRSAALAKVRGNRPCRSRRRCGAGSRRWSSRENRNWAERT